MNTCGHQFCPKCGALLIHLLHRQGFESASGFGQVVWREGPVFIACGDLDLYVHVKTLRLLRIIEHKQLGQKLSDGQREVLFLLAALIEHGRDVLKLHKDSGVYLIQGAVEADTRRICFDGAQNIWQMKNLDFSKIASCRDAEQVFRWLEATPEPGPRRRSGHWTQSE